MKIVVQTPHHAVGLYCKSTVFLMIGTLIISRLTMLYVRMLLYNGNIGSKWITRYQIRYPLYNLPIF